MAETVLETLVIKVDSDTSSADAGLTGLQKTLAKFKSAANTGSSGTKKLSACFSSFTSRRFGVFLKDCYQAKGRPNKKNRLSRRAKAPLVRDEDFLRGTTLFRAYART